MARIRFTTTIDEDLLLKAKELAESQGLEGANAVIEDALRIYFANCSTQVWEKELKGGWIKKVIVRPDKVTFECIRSRKILRKFNPKYFTPEALELKDLKRVWKCRKD